MYPLFFFSFAIIASLIHISRTKKRTSAKLAEIFLMYLIFFNIGVQGVFAFMGHAFMAGQIAREIGWPIGSPFQFEVAVANLGMGVAGLLGIFWKKTYWLAVLIMSSVFIFGAAYGHFVQMAKGDMSPYNSGIFLYVGDIIIPTIIVIVAIWYFSSNSKAK